MHFILKALLCTVDSVARPIVQNRVQYNGYYGCSWCYSFGKHVGGCMRFLMEKKEASDRTHSEHLKHITQAMKKSKTGGSKNRFKGVKGVKGYCVLTELNNFDVVWSFARDYLHSDLIGVVSHLWSTWINPKSRIRLTRDQVNKINDRLINMTPPQEIHRLVRSITSERSKWKASEWQSWMLFYAIPCLHGIIDDSVLQHFAIFVNSMHTLLQESITEKELQQVERDLHFFVGTYEVLYGEEFLTFNVHTLKHLVLCVINSGPIWATSTFPFENTIFYLKQCVHSPKGIFQQMAKKTLQANVCQCIIEEVADEKTCKDYCQSLFARSEISSFYRTASDNTVLIGKGTHDPKYDTLSQTGNTILTFQRCIFKGMVINSILYERATKSDNTTFSLENGKFVQVLNLLLFDENAYAEVVNFQVQTIVLSSTNERCIFQTVGSNKVVCKTLVKVRKRLNTDFIPVSFLKEKCVVIRVESDIYISKLPKTFEIQ